MAVSPPVCNFGWKALEFELPSTAGKKVDLNQVKGPNGTLIMFICNHCPYVTSAIDRIIFDATELMDLGIGVVSICSNDAITYPDDSFDKMIEFAKNNNFPFPYLHDENQEIAKSYDAECTPDFFGFNSNLELQYRGRLDSSGRMGSLTQPRTRDLVNAMKEIANSGNGPKDQIPSMGCSIKWK
ncbi:MAG: thioredoxin family protein [Paracoccaceae bacterium]|nr:thioredoxin family protein [Paracoccaceae bacterium]MDE2759550.1 thioredoxin family protein [Paracoccaceae bacterium]MDE2915770.1 thioredoxin family protein [Paracoccaceae bacterium]